jgi:hypothetical protein
MLLSSLSKERMTKTRKYCSAEPNGRSQRPLQQVRIIYNCSVTLLTQDRDGRRDQKAMQLEGKTASNATSMSDYSYVIPFTDMLSK